MRDLRYEKRLKRATDKVEHVVHIEKYYSHDIRIPISPLGKRKI